jgi:hypothetical protein
MGINSGSTEPEVVLGQLVEIIALYDNRCWIRIQSLDLYTVCDTVKLSEI